MPGAGGLRHQLRDAGDRRRRRSCRAAGAGPGRNRCRSHPVAGGSDGDFPACHGPHRTRGRGVLPPAHRSVPARDLRCRNPHRPRDSDQPNAYQTYEDGRPVIAFNKAFINDIRNEDEVAFVIGHEMGHHMAAHIDKRQGQAVAGALIVGALAGIAGNAIDPDMSDQAMRRTIGAGMAVGALGGSRAYSQTYELEADTIGVYIALAAGYDPERGARIFARGAAARNPDGSLNFLATHPPSARRLAQVSATTTAARAGRTN
ncbi:MAG: M48 family metalloprotease [Rhodobacteraceae bacterium]|nr:M48 family metalloprotease [Paracoccaceae bacterium]